MLVFGGFLLLGGRTADLLGRRRLFIGGLSLFAAASLAGGLAQSAGWLVAAGAVQGLGAAPLSPAALSLVTVLFAEGSERNRAMGVWAAAVGSGGPSASASAPRPSVCVEGRASREHAQAAQHGELDPVPAAA